MRKHSSISESPAIVACFLMVLWPSGRVAFGQQDAGLDWDVCRRAQMCRSPAPRPASGASKLRAAPLRASCNRSPQGSKSIAQTTTFSSSQRVTRRYGRRLPESMPRQKWRTARTWSFRVHDQWSVSRRCSRCERNVDCKRERAWRLLFGNRLHMSTNRSPGLISTSWFQARSMAIPPTMAIVLPEEP